MEFLPEAAGPQDPVVTTTPRSAGSIRRTSSIDINRPGGLHADAVVDARARDLRTTADGQAEVVGEATLRATISATRQLVSIETSPELPALQDLIGGSVGSGFRSRINEIASGPDGEGSLLFLLLDDLPGATLVSGYAVHRAGGFDDVPSPDPSAAVRKPDLSRQANVCAGWAEDASMVLHVGQTGSIPVPLGPPAPVLEAGDDPDSWHAMAPLAPHGVRRRRRLDLAPPSGGESAHRIDLHFRDSHADGEGSESIMHEYTITGTVDAEAGRVLDVSARAQVLPWLECPGAVASARRIAGMEFSELRLRVRKEFVGRSTCTHLNDSLRSLADTAALYRELEKA